MEKNSVRVTRPDEIRRRMEEVGYSTISGFVADMDNAVSETTFFRIVKSGRASEASVAKIMAASPDAAYILFGKKHGQKTARKQLPKKVKKKVRKFAESVRPVIEDGTVHVEDLIEEIKRALS